MNVTVEIPAAFRRHAGGESRVQAITGATVSDALQVLADRCPALRPQLFAADGRLFGFVGVFLNSEDIRRLQGMQTPLTHGDVIAVVPAIAGG